MRYLIAILLLLALTACETAATPSPLPKATTPTPIATRAHQPTLAPYDRIPEQTDDGWQTASSAESGLDPLRLSRMLNAIYRGPGRGDTLVMANGDSKFENIHSILIVRGGKLVFEEYFYHYDRNAGHDTASVTKSFTSLLIGLAIDQDYLSLNEPILPWFPDYTPTHPDKRWDQITVEDLLTMRHGLECDDHSTTSRAYWRWNFEWNTLDTIGSVFTLPVETDPGTHFSYCSASIVMLGAVLAQATGVPVAQFANQNLFTPLGLPRVGFMELPGGWTNSGGNAYTTPRAMARVGQLVLQEGRWNDTQIIPQAWIQTSIEKHVTLNSMPRWGNSYGYLWWLSEIQVGGKLVRAISADGIGGQNITIFPELDTVVVMTGGNYENDEGQPFQIMERYILPAILLR